MKLKNIKFSILLLSILMLDSCTNYKIRTENTLVFRVYHKDKIYPEYSSATFSLLKLNLIDHFKFYINDSIGSPQIVYNITANGGSIIMDYFIVLDTYGCCEFGDIETAYIKNKFGTINNQKLSEYSYINEMTLSQFKDSNSINFHFTKGSEIYNIDVWLADLEYCECEFFMGTPQQRGINGKGVLIKSINSVNKPNKNIKCEIERILEKLVFLNINK